MFSRRTYQFLLNITAGLTSLWLDTMTAPSKRTPSIAPVSKNDYNKTNSRLIRMTQDTNWKSSIHRLFWMVTVPFQLTEYNGIRNVIMYVLPLGVTSQNSYDDVTWSL